MSLTAAIFLEIGYSTITQLCSPTAVSSIKRHIFCSSLCLLKLNICLCFLNDPVGIWTATRVLWWNKDREKRSIVGAVTSTFSCTSSSPAGDGTAAEKTPGSQLCLFWIFGIYETCMPVMKTSTEPSQGVRTQAGMCVHSDGGVWSASECSLAWKSAYKLCTCVKQVWRSRDLFFFFS